MEEDHSLAGNKQKAVSCTLLPSGLRFNAEDADSKKQNCLCAPTTHVGSFRCRLHRRPPPSPVFSQHAVKKGLASEKALSPKVKVGHHKLLSGKRASSCSASSRLQHELPGLSRLSRTSAVKEQTPPSWPDQEALTTLWKTSGTLDEANESVNQITASEANREEPSSAKKSYIQPLSRLPSI